MDRSLVRLLLLVPRRRYCLVLFSSSSFSSMSFPMPSSFVLSINGWANVRAQSVGHKTPFPLNSRCGVSSFRPHCNTFVTLTLVTFLCWALRNTCLLNVASYVVGLRRAECGFDCAQHTTTTAPDDGRLFTNNGFKICCSNYSVSCCIDLRSVRGVFSLNIWDLNFIFNTHAYSIFIAILLKSLNWSS